MDPIMLIVLVFVLLLIFGYGGYSVGGPYWGGGIVGVILLVLLVLLVTGRL